MWDAGRAGPADGDQLSYTAAIAATLAFPPPCRTPSSTSRCTAGSGSPGNTTPTSTCAGPPPSQAVVDAEERRERRDRPRPPRRHAGLPRSTCRPRPRRSGRRCRPEVARLRELDGDARKQALIETGLRDAALAPAVGPGRRRAIEQLVIEQEFAAAGLKRPALRHHRLGHPHPDPVRHPGPGCPLGPPALNQERDLVPAVQRAGRRLRRGRHQDEGDRVADGGWLINGQKVWTSGAQLASYGLATVRTNPDAPKHDGITMMVIDMHAQGRHGPAAADAHRRLGLQRGVLRRRVRARRRRGRAGRRRLDGRQGHPRQRERQHRRRRTAAWSCRRGGHRTARRPSGPALGRRWPGRPLRGQRSRR